MATKPRLAELVFVPFRDDLPISFPINRYSFHYENRAEGYHCDSCNSLMQGEGILTITDVDAPPESGCHEDGVPGESWMACSFVCATAIAKDNDLILVPAENVNEDRNDLFAD